MKSAKEWAKSCRIVGPYIVSGVPHSLVFETHIYSFRLTWFRASIDLQIFTSVQTNPSIQLGLE